MRTTFIKKSNWDVPRIPLCVWNSKSKYGRFMNTFKIQDCCKNEQEQEFKWKLKLEIYGHEAIETEDFTFWNGTYSALWSKDLYGKSLRYKMKIVLNWEIVVGNTSGFVCSCVFVCVSACICRLWIIQVKLTGYICDLHKSSFQGYWKLRYFHCQSVSMFVLYCNFKLELKSEYGLEGKEIRGKKTRNERK